MKTELWLHGLITMLLVTFIYDLAFTANSPSNVIIDVVYSDISCVGASDGYIDVTITGGQSPYTFTWTNNSVFFSNDEDINSLGTGNYCLVVTDSLGEIVSICQIIENPPPLTISGQVEPISCNSACDGSVDVSGQGGTPGTAYGEIWDYQYRLYSISTGVYTSWQTSTVFDNLCPDYYSVEVIDYNGCISFYPDFLISDPPVLGLNNYYVSNLYCNGLSNGFIEIAIAGGGSPYFINWSNGSTSSSLSSLEAGEYFLTLTNFNCSFDTSFIISEPDSISASISHIDATCQGVGNASISVDIVGGVMPYTTYWTKDAVYYSSDEDLYNIGAGVYSLNIIDFNGCQYLINETITEPPSLTLISGQVEEVSCYNGVCDGVIEIGVSGGTPGSAVGALWNYNYRLYIGNTGQYSVWQSDSIFNNLCAGSYSIEVRDYNNCISAYPFFEVDEPDPFVVSSIINAISCVGCNDGSIDISVTGGNSPYFYLWSNGEVSEDIDQLLAGEYFLTFTDINSCMDSASFIVPSVPDPGWPVINTGITHTIFFDDTTNAYLDCSPLITGDFIGVFYDSLGTLACGGYFLWDGDSILMDVYGDDPFQSGKSGFYVNEEFQWKAWRASDSTLHDLYINYNTGNPLYPDLDYFVIDGASSVENLFSIVPQILYLPAGWSMFSLNTNPIYPNIIDLFLPIQAHVIIIKNGNGLMYWPAFSLNNIGNVVIGEAYQINMFYADTLIVDGICLRPELTPIVINSGWSMLGYLRKNPASVIPMVSTVQSSIIIIKNDNGAAYWPFFGLNLIGDMLPGKGYQIKMSVQDTLTYPANDTVSIYNIPIPVY